MTSTPASNDPQQDLVELWEQSPDRHVFIIDEARFGRPEAIHPGETVVFAVVCTRASHLLAMLRELERLRNAFPRQPQRPIFKARRIFGREEPKVYAGHRHALGAAVFSSDLICRYATTTPHLLGLQNTPTRLTDGSTITGREFPVLQLMMKDAANQVGAGAEEIDVLVDRSASLGIDPNQRSLTTGQFQMYVAGLGSLNTRTDGSPAAVTSPAGFRIIAIGEETLSLGDVLLLPDTVAYLSRAATVPFLGDVRLPTGVVPFEPKPGAEFFAVQAPR